jgi:transketolase
LRALPNITICAPSSAYESECLVEALVTRPGPGYLRLERDVANDEDSSRVPCELGRARVIREGTHCTIIATGGVVSEAIAAAENLKEQGKPCRVISMHTIKPLDTTAVIAAAAETGGICTVEENMIAGGLGGAIAEICLESPVRPRRFLRLGIKDRFTSTVGDQDYLRRANGIDRHGIAKSVATLID